MSSDYPEPPRSDWADFALLSEAADPEEYRDIWGAVQDDENWRQLTEQVIVPFDSYADIPDPGPFDGAKAEALDSNVVFRWDESAGDWIALNTGTSENPVPGTSHFESVEAEKTQTDDLVGSLIVGQGQYNTVQAAIDAMGAGSTGTMADYSEGEVLVPFKDGEGWEETIAYAGHQHLTLKGLGQNSARIAGTGGHAVTMDANDGELNGFRVDNLDADTNDAIHVSSREARITDVGNDDAGRSGLRITSNGQESIISDCEFSGGNSEAVYIDADECLATNLAIKTPPADGLVLGPNAAFCDIDATVDTGQNADAVRVEGPLNELNLTINAAGSGSVLNVSGGRNYIDGMLYVNEVDVSGNNNVLSVMIDSVDAGVNISGDGNQFSGWIDDDVTLESGASDNDLTSATITGTVNDNSGNSTNDY